MVGAEGDELVAFEQQGREDWAAILLHRARELKPGGRLVLINFAKTSRVDTWDTRAALICLITSTLTGNPFWLTALLASKNIMV